MRKRMSLSMGIALATALVFSAGMAQGQECDYFDEWGVSTIEIGAGLITNALQQVDTGGNFSQYYDYATWDLNQDGIADSVQFALLSQLLCLPDTFNHPTINIAEVKAQFNANLASYWDQVNLFLTKEAVAIAMAPNLVAMANEIFAIVGTSGANPCNLPLDVVAYNLHESWDGKTVRNLALFLKDFGEGVNWHVGQGNIGGPFSLARTTLDNRSTSHLFAALMGPDDHLVDRVLGIKEFVEVERAMALANMNWQALQDDLFACSGSQVDPTLVASVDASFDDIGLTNEYLDEVIDEIEILTSDGVEILSPEAQWGPNPDDTLANLVISSGGDVDVIWDTVKDTFQPPQVPVAGTIGISLLAALIGIAGLRRVRK